eukprot:742439-Alexandrium_andersonii.AAC.1
MCIRDRSSFEQPLAFPLRGEGSPHPRGPPPKSAPGTRRKRRFSLCYRGRGAGSPPREEAQEVA